MKIKIKNMILNYLINIVASLNAIHVGKLFIQIKATIKLGLLISPIAFIIDRVSTWGFNNSDYIIFVLIAIAVDHGLGSWKHAFVDKDFSMKENLKGLMIKIALVVACGLLFEGLNVIIHKESFVKEYLTITTRLIVFLYPAGSAFGNSSIISNGKFPPKAWLDKLKRFQTNLDPKEIAMTEEKKEIINED